MFHKPFENFTVFLPVFYVHKFPSFLILQNITALPFPPGNWPGGDSEKAFLSLVLLC